MYEIKKRVLKIKKRQKNRLTLVQTKQLLLLWELKAFKEKEKRIR
jgi:hypothetical protein